MWIQGSGSHRLQIALWHAYAFLVEANHRIFLVWALTTLHPPVHTRSLHFTAVDTPCLKFWTFGEAASDKTHSRYPSPKRWDPLSNGASGIFWSCWKIPKSSKIGLFSINPVILGFKNGKKNKSKIRPFLNIKIRLSKNFHFWVWKCAKDISE